MCTESAPSHPDLHSSARGCRRASLLCIYSRHSTQPTSRPRNIQQSGVDVHRAELAPRPGAALSLPLPTTSPEDTVLSTCHAWPLCRAATPLTHYAQLAQRSQATRKPTKTHAAGLHMEVVTSWTTMQAAAPAHTPTAAAAPETRRRQPYAQQSKHASLHCRLCCTASRHAPTSPGPLPTYAAATLRRALFPRPTAAVQAQCAPPKASAVCSAGARAHSLALAAMHQSTAHSAAGGFAERTSIGERPRRLGHRRAAARSRLAPAP